MGSAVIPGNQSKNVYTNSSGGAVTVNFYGQAFCDTKNSTLGVKLVNNCNITPTSTACVNCACVCVVDCFGHMAVGLCEQVRYYIDPDTCQSDAVMYISSGCNYDSGSNRGGYCSDRDHDVKALPRIYIFGNDGCVMMYCAHNCGLACSCSNASYMICDCTTGSWVIGGDCQTYGSIFARRKQGWVFPDPDDHGAIDPCANYMMGFAPSSFCSYNGGMDILGACCHCGRNTKIGFTKNCCVTTTKPSCILAYQFKDACVCTTTIPSFCMTSSLGYDDLQGWCYCREYVPTYVSFDPLSGNMVSVNLEIDTSGFGCGNSGSATMFMAGTYKTGVGGNCFPGVHYQNNDTSGCCQQRDIANGRYAPFFIADGIMIRQDHACRNLDYCLGTWVNIFGKGNCLNENSSREMLASCHWADRCCCCKACVVCTSYVSVSNPGIRWLHENWETNAMYIHWADECLGWGGIYQIDMSQEAEASPSCTNVVEGPITDPTTLGFICCKVTDYSALPLGMQGSHATLNSLMRLQPCCYVALYNGCCLLRSENLYEWTTFCDWKTGLDSTFCFVQVENNGTRCYFSTDDTAICRSDNLFTTLACDGMIEYKLSINNYSNGGIVLSNNDTVMVNNFTNTPFAFQVWGYEDS